jgi:flagellar basal body-associated protein FliL
MGITKILSILIGVVVTIITLAFVGSYIANVFSGTKTAQAASEFSTIVANVQGLYASQPNFSGLTNTVAIQGGIYPTNMATTTSSAASDPWGGSATIDVGASNSNEFTIEFDNVPQNACIKMGLSYESSNLVSLTIGGSSVTLPITPALITTACTTATSSGSVNMIWTLN